MNLINLIFEYLGIQIIGIRNITLNMKNFEKDIIKTQEKGYLRKTHGFILGLLLK